jgi:excisionase family DNA binding protein
VRRPEEPERLLYRVEEAAAMLGVSRSKLYELAAAGTIPSVKIGAAIRIPADALREWLAEQTTNAK